MRQQAAPGFEAVELIQVGIGKDRRELQDLVERGVRACGFGIVWVAVKQTECMSVSDWARLGEAHQSNFFLMKLKSTMPCKRRRKSIRLDYGESNT